MQDLDIILSSLVGSLCITLTSPATLEHLKFNIRFRGRETFNHFYDNLRYAEVWGHLDSITTHPTSSQLQRVDISINYLFHREHNNGAEPDKDEVLKAILDGLPLLYKKGILFVETFLGR